MVLSGGMGVVIGVMASLTRRVWLGVPLGGILSGIACFMLGIVPGYFGYGMGGDKSALMKAELDALWELAPLWMAIVGAVAGGVGAYCTKRFSRNCETCGCRLPVIVLYSAPECSPCWRRRMRKERMRRSAT
jgi:hypothetical protein